MDEARYDALMETGSGLEISAEEFDAGWHFCLDFDGLLVGPEMPELIECCSCHPKGGKWTDPDAEDAI